MDENILALLVDLHREGKRQGPGSDAITRKAMALGGLSADSGLKIADIGCGTGAASLILAGDLGAQVTAVDLFPDFLDQLSARAEAAGLGDQITTVQASMDDLPFDAGRFDVIWSEGAIYNMGFEAGIRAWQRFLRPGGLLAVSELSWFTAERPPALEAYWSEQYPGVATASAKMGQLEAAGYLPVGYFPLPASAWLDEYYAPTQARVPAFLKRHQNSEAAQAVIEMEQAEIAHFTAHHHQYGYGFYLARTPGG
ncbi:class I SAM-dependent methyltransferase [Maricaulis sp.]|uniref:class I SAM-dependent methyltransferase n=1 Tax=Maricaulis sp. TaxID=1486257 RepID=UPI00262D4A75|nr:class I SAM-dependent methyltransferase [Maricaulis sp.]